MCAVRLPLPLQTTGSTYSIVWLDAFTIHTHSSLSHTCALECSCMHAAYLLVVIIHRNRFELRLSTVFHTSFFLLFLSSDCLGAVKLSCTSCDFAINSNGIYADSNFVGHKQTEPIKMNTNEANAFSNSALNWTLPLTDLHACCSCTHTYRYTEWLCTLLVCIAKPLSFSLLPYTIFGSIYVCLLFFVFGDFFKWYFMCVSLSWHSIAPVNLLELRIDRI